MGFGIFGIVAGTVAAVLLAPATGGASLALLAVITASAVASGALDIASGVLEDSNPELSKKLGTAALVVGIPSMIDGVARLPGLVKSGYQLVREAPKLLRTANELYDSGVRSLLKARSTLSAVRTQGLSGRGAPAAGRTMAQAHNAEQSVNHIQFINGIRTYNIHSPVARPDEFLLPGGFSGNPSEALMNLIHPDRIARLRGCCF